LGAVRVHGDGARSSAPTIFVSDPTVEAEQVAQVLRRMGYGVVDVPLTMLVARVAVQHPRLVIVDSDSEGALDVVARMRELPEADDIHVLYLGRPGGTISSPEDAVVHEASGLFLRPVDVAALVRKVELLTGRAEPSQPSEGRAPDVPDVAQHGDDGANPSGGSTSPPASPPTSPGPALLPRSSPPSLPPASIRSGSNPPSDKPPSDPRAARPSKAPSKPPSKPPSDPPSGTGQLVSRRGFAVAPPLSAELRELLAEAERRVQVRPDPDSVVPSPEEEIEAVLPAELLATLDEPLEEEDEEEDGQPQSRHTAGPSGGLERTGEGSVARTTGATTGGGATPGGLQSPKPATGEEPLTHSPWLTGASQTPAGTHGGPTGPGTSSDGGSERHVRSEAAPPATTAQTEPLPAVVGRGEAMGLVARCIAARMTGTLLLTSPDAERRIVMREGDIVTAASAAEEESLLAFLGTRGDLPRETVRRLGVKFPLSGRHAAAALVARGYLRQDQMWTTLRAHAEWILVRAMQTPGARVAVDAAPGRLGDEPSVFGGSTGAEVFVDLVRRVVAPLDAIERLGGPGSRIMQGAAAELVSECALGAADLALIRAATDASLRDALASSPEGDLPTVLLALVQLGVLDVMRGGGAGGEAAEGSAPDVAALDAEAIRERIRARLELVQEGNYFAVLGVPREATGYEIRRAFLELRRAFEPSRLITPEAADLAEQVRTIVFVLEEAYDVLRDAARRERYRRALEAPENLPS